MRQVSIIRQLPDNPLITSTTGSIWCFGSYSHCIGFRRTALMLYNLHFISLQALFGDLKPSLSLTNVLFPDHTSRSTFLCCFQAFHSIFKFIVCHSLQFLAFLLMNSSTTVEMNFRCRGDHKIDGTGDRQFPKVHRTGCTEVFTKF